MAAQKFELSDHILTVTPGKDTSRSTLQSDARELHVVAPMWLVRKTALLLLHTTLSSITYQP